LPSAVPRHRSCVTVSGAYVCACGHKLSLTATFSLSPPPLLRRGVGPLHSAVNPKPPLAIPSRRCRAASFLLPFTQCIFGCTRHSQTSLPLLSFARKFARMPYCQPRSSHPQRKKPPTFQALCTFLLFVCDADPNPKPRCAVRRCTDSTPAVGQPLHSLRVCLRLRARAGRHIVLVQAHDKEPVAPCLRDTCRLR